MSGERNEEKFPHSMRQLGRIEQHSLIKVAVVGLLVQSLPQRSFRSVFDSRSIPNQKRVQLATGGEFG